MKALLSALLIVVLAFGIFVGGQAYLESHPKVGPMWNTILRPLRLIQYRHVYAQTKVVEGQIRQSTDGNWGLTYSTPDASGATGIAFRVPESLAEQVKALRGLTVAVTIGNEPDPEYYNHSRYVLKAIEKAATPLP